MEEQSANQVLDRIDAALARIEAAAREVAQSRAGHAELGERHERLKQAVGQSLGELDTLIARTRP